MQHPDEGMIHAWIDGALDAESARDLEAHIATCEDCARLAAEARGLVAASSRILTALDNVPARVIPAAGARAKSDAMVTPRWKTPFWMRTAAAVVIVAGASALVLTPKVNTPESKIDLASAPVAMEAVVVADSALIASDAVVATQGRAEGRDMSASRAPAATQRLERLPPPQAAKKASSDAFGTTATAIADARAANAPKSPAPGVAQQPTARDSIALEDSRRAHVDENTLLRRLEERLKRIERDDTASRSLAQRQDSARKVTGDVSGVLSGAQTSSGKAVIGSGQGRQGAAAPQRAVRPPSGAMPAAASSASRTETLSDFRAKTLPGCYALSLSPWSGGTIPFGAPPARIELDSLTSLQDPIRGLNLVHPGPGAASNQAPLAYWRVLGDSVYVTWRDAQRGVLLKLPVGGEILTGTARTFTMSTASEQPQTSAVEARRINCRE